MRRWLLAILALSLGFVAAVAQGQPTGDLLSGRYNIQSMKTLDFLLVKGKTPLSWGGSIDRTPQGRGKALLDVAPQVPAGWTLQLGEGTYDLGMVSLRLTNGMRIVGAGKGLTTITCSQEDQRHACGLEVAGRNIYLEGFTGIWNSKDGLTRGGQMFGIADPNNPGNTLVIVKSCDFISYGSCAFYYWGGGKGHKGTFIDMTCSAGRWGGTLGAGSGDDSAILDFQGCVFNADFAKYGGAGGDMGRPPNTCAFVQRGGMVTAEDTIFNATGYAGNGNPTDPNGMPFDLTIGYALSSIGDPSLPQYPYKWPYATLLRCKANVKANGSKRAIDVQEYIGTLKIDKQFRGSGPDGTPILDGGVEVIDTVATATGN